MSACCRYVAVMLRVLELSFGRQQLQFIGFEACRNIFGEARAFLQYVCASISNSITLSERTWFYSPSWHRKSINDRWS